VTSLRANVEFKLPSRKALELVLISLSICIQFISTIALAQTTKYALIVSGVSGEEEFKEKFWNWSSQMVRSLTEALKFSKENILFLAEDPSKDSSIITGKATKGELAKAFDRLQSTAKPGDLLFIFILGHGNFDGNDYKFNLVGPDVTGSELKGFLDRFPKQEVVVVCSTPCSGILTRILIQKNRVIITATKNEFENNDTIFADFFVEAFKNKAADTDKNGRISVLEAYLYTAQKVDRWYKERNQLATEHPLLEDNGDRIGSPLPSPENGEGLLASKISLMEPTGAVAELGESSAANPELQALYSNKQRIEAELQGLKYKKSSLSEAQYNQQLENLLVELAQTNQKIKNFEKQ